MLGVKCRYNGKDKADEKILELSKKEELIPVCPEQLGGLSTPREPAERKGDRMITISGKDVTENFERGAEETLRIAKMMGVKEAILKQKSPSCGCGKVYDGTFTGKIIKEDGITASLLKRNGIKVMSEEDL